MFAFFVPPAPLAVLLTVFSEETEQYQIMWEDKELFPLQQCANILVCLGNVSAACINHLFAQHVKLFHGEVYN